LNSSGCSPSNQQKPLKPADIAEGQPDFVLTAEEFAKEWETSPKAAWEKYKGRIVELSGVVHSVWYGLITLDSGADHRETVSCFTVDKEPFASVSGGQTVKIKGTCVPQLGQCQFHGCVIMQTGPAVVLVVKSADLGKEFDTDAEVAEKKYVKKYLIVSGPVEETSEKDGWFDLAGAGVRIRCGYAPIDAHRFASAKKGQTVKVYGECHFSPKENLVTIGDIRGCALITKTND
jgi:hypothetical protein